MSSLFESDRLLIRDWNPQLDAPAAFAIYGDREVMKFIRKPDANIKAVQQRLEERIERYKQYNNGTGTWAIVEKETEQIVGCILLIQLPDNNLDPTEDYEIGWHLRRASWGKGYATEAARVIIDYGFNTLQLPVLYAVVRPDNIRSVQVTQRLGMTPMGLTYNYYATTLLLFKLEAEYRP